MNATFLRKSGPYSIVPVIILTALLFFSCEEEPVSPNSGDDNQEKDTTKTEQTWSIPQEHIYDGGPGKDGIPALTHPEFVSINRGNFLDPGDLVVGVKFGDQIHAYPHEILDWHEIVNDTIAGKEVSVTYCPLTGSALGWHRTFDGSATTFGVSGLLYNNNLIPYDRSTDSHWSQMKMKAVEGEMKGKSADLFRIVETTWDTWKEMYPSTKVLSRDTEYNRPYGRYPYGDYKTNHSAIYFPVTHKDERLPAKTRVLGLLAEGDLTTRLAFQVSEFPDSTHVMNLDYDNSDPYVVIGNRAKSFAVSYRSQIRGEDETLKFEAIQGELPVVMKDQNGTEWTIFGRAVSGPDTGKELKIARSYIAYWFAWAAFYRGSSIQSISN